MRWSLGLVLALTACSSAPSPFTNDGGTGDSAADGPTPILPDAGPTGDAAMGCSTEATLVYVVDSQRNVYSFEPKALKFTPVGSLSCMSTGTFSMAVDRNAIAYVLGIDGKLARYDIRTKACSMLPFASSQHGFTTFGMGFASNSKGSSDETLFVASAIGLGLAKIDTSTLLLDPIANFDKLGGRVELTGTGDGQLFGLFEGTPYVLGEVEKTTAKVLSQAPQPPTNVANFAFAFWGGEFYSFIAKDVIRYSPSTKASAKVTSVAFDVVGAGVSTCAPTYVPN